MFRGARSFLIVALAAVSLQAATFVVPSDEILIRDSKAIVSATVVAAEPRFDESGDIETVFTLRIDEVLKGGVQAQFLPLVEWGGRIGDRATVMSGAPRYELGKSYLVFLTANRHGEWTTQHLTLGRFERVRGLKGDLLVRDAGEIHGWDMQGNAAVEQERSAEPFQKFVRERAAGIQSPAVYFADGIVRNDTTDLRSAPIETDAADYDFDDAAEVGAAAWTDDDGTNVQYSISATPASGDVFSAGDTEDRIIEEDPHGVIPGAFTGSGTVATASWSTSGSDHLFEGDSYGTITGADVVTQDGLKASSFSQNKLRTTMAHELGHTLGFRHSNQNCTVAVPCTSAAVMNSSVGSYNGVLQQWDIDAVNAVYGSGGDASDYVTARHTTPTLTYRLAKLETVCTPVSITTQPAAVTNMFHGSTIQLSTIAAGSSPLTYTWYQGVAPDTTKLLGETKSNKVNITPQSVGTYNFWARVSNTCDDGSSADTNTVIVNVTPCPGLTVNQPTSTPGLPTKFMLSITGSSTATPVTYEWFKGTTPGAGGEKIASTQSVTVTATTATSFWARVKNGCNRTVVSSLITVGGMCTLPTISAQPADVTISSGQTANLSIVFLNGTSVKWYSGVVGDRSNEVGATANITVGPLTATSQFWAEVSGVCGAVSSRQVTVTVAGTQCNLAELVPLLGGRFFVQVAYKNQFDNGKEGKLLGCSLFSTALSETAVFTFGDPKVVELLVRVSDARPFENRIHIFLGGLSDVEFSVVVTDSLTGIVHQYAKPANQLIGVIDRNTFPATNDGLRGAFDSLKVAPLGIKSNAESSTIRLLNNRFEVRMRYRNPFTTPAGEGYMNARSIASSPTTETAVFFFDENIGSAEWMVRFSDARPFENRIDLFHGGLSDVEFTIEVLDTQTGQRKEYHKPPFSLLGQVDRNTYLP